MASKVKEVVGIKNLKAGKKPPPAQHDSTILDLAFAIDTTGSMGSYIEAAQKSLKYIVEELVSSEKSDIHLALVEYRDHPPQESSFVTRVHDFTDSVQNMKRWLDASSASGGGDGPEAVADALHDVLKLSWRPEATKICVFIADAPPHGLNEMGDSFPDGCPLGLDPVVIINQIAAKNITMYSVGCEPAIDEYRDFFMALAHITGGQYIPLTDANQLAKVIIGGATEEITLSKLMKEVKEEVVHEMEALGSAKNIDEEELSARVQTKLTVKGTKAKALYRHNAKLDSASDFAKDLSRKTNMSEWKYAYKRNPDADGGYASFLGSGRKMKTGEAFGEIYGAVSGVVEGEPLPGTGTLGVAGAEAVPSAEVFSVVEENIDIMQTTRLVRKTLAMLKKSEEL